MKKKLTKKRGKETFLMEAEDGRRVTLHKSHRPIIERLLAEGGDVDGYLMQNGGGIPKGSSLVRRVEPTTSMVGMAGSEGYNQVTFPGDTLTQPQVDFFAQYSPSTKTNQGYQLGRGNVYKPSPIDIAKLEKARGERGFFQDLASTFTYPGPEAFPLPGQIPASKATSVHPMDAYNQKLRASGIITGGTTPLESYGKKLKGKKKGGKIKAYQSGGYFDNMDQDINLQQSANGYSDFGLGAQDAAMNQQQGNMQMTPGPLGNPYQMSPVNQNIVNPAPATPQVKNTRLPKQQVAQNPTLTPQAPAVTPQGQPELESPGKVKKKRTRVAGQADFVPGLGYNANMSIHNFNEAADEKNMRNQAIEDGTATPEGIRASKTGQAGHNIAGIGYAAKDFQTKLMGTLAFVGKEKQDRLGDMWSQQVMLSQNRDRAENIYPKRGDDSELGGGTMDPLAKSGLRIRLKKAQEGSMVSSVEGPSHDQGGQPMDITNSGTTGADLNSSREDAQVEAQGGEAIAVANGEGYVFTKEKELALPKSEYQAHLADLIAMDKGYSLNLFNQAFKNKDEKDLLTPAQVVKKAFNTDHEKKQEVKLLEKLSKQTEKASSIAYDSITKKSNALGAAYNTEPELEEVQNTIKMKSVAPMAVIAPLNDRVREDRGTDEEGSARYGKRLPKAQAGKIVTTKQSVADEVDPSQIEYGTGAMTPEQRLELLYWDRTQNLGYIGPKDINAIRQWDLVNHGDEVDSYMQRVKPNHKAIALMNKNIDAENKKDGGKRPHVSIKDKNLNVSAMLSAEQRKEAYNDGWWDFRAPEITNAIKLGTPGIPVPQTKTPGKKADDPNAGTIGAYGRKRIYQEGLNPLQIAAPLMDLFAAKQPVPYIEDQGAKDAYAMSTKPRYTDIQPQLNRITRGKKAATEFAGASPVEQARSAQAAANAYEAANQVYGQKYNLDSQIDANFLNRQQELRMRAGTNKAQALNTLAERTATRDWKDYAMFRNAVGEIGHKTLQQAVENRTSVLYQDMFPNVGYDGLVTETYGTGLPGIGLDPYGVGVAGTLSSNQQKRAYLRKKQAAEEYDLLYGATEAKKYGGKIKLPKKSVKAGKSVR